ncbi:MAG: NAD-dependent epimerase/dehydratase [Bacteroidetes bacterium]|nr:NAD-dependent epimerase/dehydratase [Bacteroidota bacterium]
MNAAVVGANGFLGRNLISALLEKKFRVLALYNNNNDRIPEGCTKIPVTRINKIPLITDYLFITIGNHSLDQKKFDAQREFINSILQKVSFQKVIYVSSVAVYGAHSDVIKEESNFNTPSIYGQAKIAEEKLIVQQKNYAIIRFTYLYGAGMDQNSLLPKMCKQAKQNKSIAVYGNGSRKQDYLEVSDAVELLIAAALQEENEIFIGATGTSFSNKEVAEEIAVNIPGTTIELMNEDKAPSFFYDVEKTKTELNWQPRVAFNDGIKKMIEHDLADL